MAGEQYYTLCVEEDWGRSRYAATSTQDRTAWGARSAL